MGVVIDEMESTVEPDAAAAGPAQHAEPTAPPSQMPLDQLMVDLHRVARRQMRLRAD